MSERRATTGFLRGVRETVAAAADLAVPIRCGGCDAPGVRWCRCCAAAFADDPIELSPRVSVGVPVWAMGRYRGPHRSAIVALKERGRRDLREPLARTLAQGLLDLARWSEIPRSARSLVLIPAPTRWLSARRRGGDPVTLLAREAAALLGARVTVAPVLRTRPWASDSAGLSARRRVANLDDAVVLRRSARTLAAALDERGAAVVLVDDVLTTGATAAESVRVLGAAGIAVDAVLVLAGA